MDGGDEMVLFLNMYVSGRLMVFLCSGFFFSSVFLRLLLEQLSDNIYVQVLVCTTRCASR